MPATRLGRSAAERARGCAHITRTGGSSTPVTGDSPHLAMAAAGDEVSAVLRWNSALLIACGVDPLSNHLTTVTAETLRLGHDDVSLAEPCRHTTKETDMAGSPTRCVPARRHTTVGATTLAAVLVLAGCGNGTDSAEPDAPEAEADEELAAMVPEEFREAGELRIGVNAEYPPGEYLDDDQETIVGFNVDLFDAVADKLDLDVHWENAPFDNIIIGVDSGEYDAGVSSFTINEERLEQVTMVSYFTVGTQWFTRSDNPDDVDPDDACGLNIAVETATVQVDDLEARSEECVEAGEEEISIEEFPSQENATETVVSGVNHAGLADLPVVAYAIEQTGDQLEPLGEQYEAAPYGAVIHEDADELAEAVQAGYGAIIDDGIYDEILSEWDVAEGGIPEPEVNPEVGPDEDEAEAEADEDE